MSFLRNFIPPIYILIPVIWLYFLAQSDDPKHQTEATQTQLNPNVYIDLKSVQTTTIPVKQATQGEITAAAKQPIFAANRKQYEPAVVNEPVQEKAAVKVETPVVEVTLEPPQLEILGVIASEGSYSALIKAQDGEKWYQQGDQIAMWTIEFVYIDHIELVHKKQKITVHIER